MIVGTSTGAIIAVLCGIYRLSMAEIELHYLRLSKQSFIAHSETPEYCSLQLVIAPAPSLLSRIDAQPIDPRRAEYNHLRRSDTLRPSAHSAPTADTAPSSAPATAEPAPRKSSASRIVMDVKLPVDQSARSSLGTTFACSLPRPLLMPA